MGFTAAQEAWLKALKVNAAEFERGAQQRVAKSKKLEEFNGRAKQLHAGLAEASEFTVNLDPEAKKTLWEMLTRKSNNEAQWHTGNQDDDIDTVHDLVFAFRSRLKEGANGNEIQLEAREDSVSKKNLKRLMLAHSKIVQLQHEMEQTEFAASSEDGLDEIVKGKPMFDRRDIERELWSPLVEAELIPSNAVADKYSREAIVFEGACEVYNDILVDHTKSAGPHEDAKRAINIAKDTVTMLGTVGGELISATHFDAAEAEEFSVFKRKEGAAGNTGQSPTPFDALSGDWEKDQWTGERGRLNMLRRKDEITLAVAVINGGLSVADKALDKQDRNYPWEVAEAVLDEIKNVAVGAVDVVNKQSGSHGQQDYNTTIARLKNLIGAGIGATKAAFRVRDIVQADEGEREKHVIALVNSLASSTEKVFASLDTQVGKVPGSDDKDAGSGNKWKDIGTKVSMAMRSVGVSKARYVAILIREARKGNTIPDVEELVAALGVSVIAQVMSVTYADASVVKQDRGKDANNQTVDPQGAQAQKVQSLSETSGSRAQAQSDLSALTGDMGQLIAGLNLTEDNVKKLEQQALQQIAAEEEENAKAELNNLLNDPVELRAFQDGIAQEVERREVADKLQELIDSATLDDKQKAEAAMGSVEKLIAEAAALNARWEMIDQLTKGAAGAIAKFAPGSGLVVAIQKLAMDIAYLVKKSMQLNTWIDNMALTYGNHSTYGAAISGRLASARVQVSQQSVRVVLDSVGVTAEACKLADITGAAVGLSIANTMAQALTEYGYKMHKEAQISHGWSLYQKALKTPGDRKIARQAMKWNSTLSKCVIAYGIVMDGDPIAKEVGRSCGLTPAILADQRDVCPKIVQYFEVLYTDDPVVKKCIPLKQDWHPGAVVLSLECWMRFKAAALARAKPCLSNESANTPKIDAALAKLDALLQRKPSYIAARDALYAERGAEQPASYQKFLEQVRDEAQALVAATQSYHATQGPCPKKEEPPWQEGAIHEGMMDVVDGLSAQAMMMLGEVEYDMKLNHKAAQVAVQRVNQIANHDEFERNVVGNQRVCLSIELDDGNAQALHREWLGMFEFFCGGLKSLAVSQPIEDVESVRDERIRELESSIQEFVGLKESAESLQRAARRQMMDLAAPVVRSLQRK